MAIITAQNAAAVKYQKPTLERQVGGNNFSILFTLTDVLAEPKVLPWTKFSRKAKHL